MTEPIVINLFWEPRVEPLDRIAHQLYMLITAMRGIDSSLAGWQTADRRGQNARAIAAKDDVKRALEQHEGRWKTGATQRVAYKPFFFVGDEARPDAEVRITCGIEPLEGMAALFLPNRVEMTFERHAGVDGLTRPTLERIFRAAVTALRPDFGYGGTATIPLPPVALASDGTPPVAWMTYLSNRYPAFPTSWDDPIVCHTLGQQGRLIVAHPELFDPGDSRQAEAIEKVKRKLTELAVLIPAVRLPPVKSDAV
jgi:hypothetical protein